MERLQGCWVGCWDDVVWMVEGNEGNSKRRRGILGGDQRGQARRARRTRVEQQRHCRA
jgi:hypothetical protein